MRMRLLAPIVRRFCSQIQLQDGTQASTSSWLHIHDSFDVKSPVFHDFISSVLVVPDFVSELEEKSLYDEVHVYLKRLRYEDEHWDDAIHTYRETEKSNWNPVNESVICRMREAAFPPETQHLTHVHVLDLAKKGYIKPHIDSQRYCGEIIAGLSLLSPSVMRLVHETQTDLAADLLLSQRSLYILRGVSRHVFKHEILSESTSYFKDQPVPRERRISIICRSLPPLPQTLN